MHTKCFKIRLAALLFALCILFSACAPAQLEQPSYSLGSVPEFSGEPYVLINEGVPEFAEELPEPDSYEYYSELDALGRCGPAEACIGEDIMPTEERGEIGQVKPTGWHTVKYDCVDGKYLYNRCHLIGYQLTGENANERNLITGTRYMNTEGMLPFENDIADYIDETGNHVYYRVTPVFEGDDLLARGVLLEAMSVEDGGEGLCFCVYVYNSQPGVEIDYSDGTSRLAEDTDAEEGAGETEYVLNTNSKKFHYPDCPSVDDMSEKNREYVTASRSELVAGGYEPCANCAP